MYTHRTDPAQILSTLSPHEHARLVGLCAQLTGDRHAAEDLAQETLLIAWRLRERISDPARVQPWLAAIARNVCHHWRRSQRREGQHFVQPSVIEATGDALAADVADSFDVEVELERAELATLLDRALALLPPETRTILVQKYVEESPHAEIAAQLGLTENAVAVRLHRGKLAFQKILHTQFPATAELFTGAERRAQLRETTIWCPICGVQHLHGDFDRERSVLELRCPVCCAGAVAAIWCTDLPRHFGGAKQVRTALEHGMAECFQEYSAALEHGTVACSQCGRLNRLQFGLFPEMTPPYPTTHGLYTLCSCGSGASSSLRMFVQSSPEVRAFWKRHPQMRTLPERAIDVNGQAAVAIRFESVTDPASLEAIIALDRYAIVAMHASTT